jgi:antitoxin (DNA-binding transcriptional repressor) of toxin-antitoxin stability system
MAIITMRELLRAPNEAFERIDEGEACVVTRRGRPVAALVPIDESEAEKFILAAAPEFARDRNAAEHAHEEGRTTPLADVAQRFGVDLEDDDDAEFDELIEQAAAEAQAAFPGTVYSYYPTDENKVANLNRHLLLRFAAAAPSATPTAAEADPGEAVGRALEQVLSFNRDAVEIERELDEQPSVYEAYVLGGIGAIERVQNLHAADTPHGLSLVGRVISRRKPG